MTNIVIYARYSSEKQTEQSIEGQLRVCHEFAERNNYNIVNEYIDRAMTGTNDHRPAFQQMIEDATKKEFEFVLVYKLDRFSRSKYDNAIYKHKLQQNGVKVISATESISNTPEGALMEGLLEMFAEMYIKDLSEKVKRGMRESILKGNFIGGIPPFGFKVVDNKLVIDDKNALAVRFIFNEYTNGTPIKQIIQVLKEKGYVNYNGKNLTYGNVNQILSNKKYIGIFDNGIIQNINYCQPIIDNNLFEKAQQRLKINKHCPAKYKAKKEYVLTSKIFCGYCGESMVGVSGTSRNGTTHCYYTCSQRWKHHNCKKENEPKEILENDIFNTIKSKLTKKYINFIAKQIHSQYNSDNIQNVMTDYNKQLNNVEKELDKCFNAFYNAQNEDMRIRLNKKADTLTIQKQDILNEIKKLKAVQQVQHSQGYFTKVLTEFTKGDLNDINYQRRLLNFIDCIYIFDDYYLIYFCFDGKAEKIPFATAHKDLQRLNSGSYLKSLCPPPLN